MWKSILKFFKQLTVSMFSGFATKMTESSKRNKAEVRIEANQKSEIRNVNLKCNNQTNGVNISQNKHVTIEDINIT